MVRLSKRGIVLVILGVLLSILLFQLRQSSRNLEPTSGVISVDIMILREALEREGAPMIIPKTHNEWHDFYTRQGVRPLRYRDDIKLNVSSESEDSVHYYADILPNRLSPFRKTIRVSDDTVKTVSMNQAEINEVSEDVIVKAIQGGELDNKTPIGDLRLMLKRVGSNQTAFELLIREKAYIGYAKGEEHEKSLVRYLKNTVLPKGV